LDNLSGAGCKRLIALEIGMYASATMESSTSTVGQSFAEALLAKDWHSLETLLDDRIDFRGLTPGRPWEATSARELIDTVFTQWFETADEIYETISIATDVITDRKRVVYRFRVRNPQDDYVCEQTAYYDEARGKIIKLRILCSGFLPSN
jgi:hypothetical protein